MNSEQKKIIIQIKATGCGFYGEKYSDIKSEKIKKIFIKNFIKKHFNK